MRAPTSLQEKPSVANPEIERYIEDLDYDPRVLLAVVPDGSTSTIPVKNRLASMPATGSSFAPRPGIR